MTRHAKQAAKVIAECVPGFQPKVGIILGSGLGALAEIVENAKIISYEDLPGFPRCSVAGHEGLLFLGKLNGVPIACLQGRAHLYEGYSHLHPELSSHTLNTPVYTLKLMGCDLLLITNSAGSLYSEAQPGSLVIINDHINFQGSNPLISIRDSEFGSTFVGMENAYDSNLRALMHNAAQELKLKLSEGVYIGVLGPSFETPAEIRAFRLWGADVVGMSTIPEVITARHCGLRVAAISVITNMAAGMSEQTLSHEVTLQGAKKALHNLAQLVAKFVGRLIDHG